MIVKIAGWLYIVQAVLNLGSLVMNPLGFRADMASLTTVVLSAIVGAVGVGLLKLDPRARWLALGSSLLGWTLGALMLLAVLAVTLFMGGVGMLFSSFAGGVMSGLAVFGGLVLITLVVSVVINFKLFWYLCSPDGCAQFGVPHGSAPAVAASSGVWVAIFIGQWLMSVGAVGPISMPAEAEQHASTDSAPESPGVVPGEPEAQFADEPAVIEAEPASPEEPIVQEASFVADSHDATPADITVDEAPLPTFESSANVRPAEDVSAAPATNGILKCRDSGGGIMFTQGYCPPGTKRVELPQGE